MLFRARLKRNRGIPFIRVALILLSLKKGNDYLNYAHYVVMDNAEILLMIRSGALEREKAIRFLLGHEKIKRNIKNHLLANRGNDADAKSILNLALVQFMKKVLKEKDFVITSNLPNYITGIAKYLWLAELRKKSRSEQEIPEHYEVEDGADQIDLQIINQERKKLLEKLLQNLSVKCRDVLMYWSYGYSMKEIAKLVNYSSDVVVRKKKFTCMKSLRNLIQERPSLLKDLEY